ncbi:MAG: M28 family peptidase [Bdellovibrionales bacterium]|nr:M28 family peptidase [Bdellovibrionales bacterium]
MTWNGLTLILSLAFASGCEFGFFSKDKPKSSVPVFNEDLAFEHTLQYEKLGPPVPGTKESTATGDWIIATLKSTGAEVVEQKTSARTHDGHQIPIRNILGRLNPDAKTRYLLSAHWDARPYADQETDPKLKKLPVPAVNDGGSGVVVLLGIAKALQGASIPFGVDFLFLDAEDWGTPSIPKSYCLGTQYFAANPIPKGYKPRFGINFDMVGRIGATFPMEVYSVQRAGNVIEKIQKAALKLGYQDYFPKSYIGPVVDDHIYLSDGLGVPVADLIHMTEEGRFPPEWHTRRDTSEFISRTTLKIVGQTVIQVLWDEEWE